jgi:hypothetical protein
VIDGKKHLLSTLGPDVCCSLRKMHRDSISAERYQKWNTTLTGLQSIDSLTLKKTQASQRAQPWGTDYNIPSIVYWNSEPAASVSEWGSMKGYFKSIFGEKMYEFVNADIESNAQPSSPKSARFFVGSVASIRYNREWAQTSYKHANGYGVCGPMVLATDKWFSDMCWKSAPVYFREYMHTSVLIPHIMHGLMASVSSRFEYVKKEEARAFFSYAAPFEFSNRITTYAMVQQTQTLVFQMSLKVVKDLQRQWGAHLSDADFNPRIMMSPSGSDFYCNFYAMVAFEVM